MERKTVAVIGASADRRKFSNKAIRAYLRQGWQVYPVNPKGGQIEGLEVFAALDAIPVKIDRVTQYLPPTVGLGVLDDVAKTQPAEYFINPGAESPELIARATELGLNPIQACSIIEIGVSPSEFAD